MFDPSGDHMRFATLLLVTVTFLLTACNTVRGMGKDVEAVGNAIQKSTR
jgi:predicted small secreted protein